MISLKATSSCLLEGSCLVYVICVVCWRAHVWFTLFVLFVGGLMSGLRYLCCLLEGSCLVYVICVVCWRAHVWFTLFVLFVGGLMSGLRYLCCLLDGSCLVYVICVSVRIAVSNIYCVVFLLFVFVLCTLCLQLLWIVPFDCPFGIL